MRGTFVWFIGLLAISLQAQNLSTNVPLSISNTRQTNVLREPSTPFDLEYELSQDSIQWNQHQQLNVARLRELSIIFPQQVKSELGQIENQTVWKTTIRSKHAYKIALKFKSIALPQNSKLFLYDSNNLSEIWNYETKSEPLILKSVITRSFQNESITLEYNGPITDTFPVFELEGTVHFYKDRAGPGFGKSTPCEVNVACPEGIDWCNENQSVVRIFIQSGHSYSYCSGSVVNNTAQDKTPYVLTAEHCGTMASDQDLNYWRFDFDYQSDHCISPSSEAEIHSQSIIGCQNIAWARRSGNTGSDFRLVKLKDTIPNEWNIYYSGWDATDYQTISGGGVSIHHPYGDIKKISTYSAPLLGCDANGQQTNQLYWETHWIETESGHGITEGGSSGSPIFNSQGYLVGTLATGSSYCDGTNENSPDFYGKFSKHWTSNGTLNNEQLKPWLDPLQTGTLKLDGISGQQNSECGSKTNYTELKVFPTPANQHLYIAHPNALELANSEIRIYDLSGRLVRMEQSSGTSSVRSVYIGDLKPTIYVLKISNSNWQAQKKFVILH